MNRRVDLREFKVVVFFCVLTVFLTIGVIGLWEIAIRPSFFAWVDTRYPGETNAQRRWDIKQRVEHFAISFMVDALVVTLLLRLVYRKQRQLRASEERYRALFEQAKDGIGVVRLSDHRLVEANNKVCEILGVPQSGCINEDIGELLRTTTPHAKAQLMMSSAGHSSVESEMIIQTPQGEDRPVAVSFTPLSTDGEEVMIMSMRDLSARKKLEAEREEMQQQLYQSSKLASIGELSAGVAHEINNPLNGVINFAQLLKDEETPRSEFEQQMIDGIIDEGERIAKIVRGLLAFARADTLELGQVHFAESIKTSIALFGRQFEKDGITVEIDLQPDLPLVRADASRLRQVVVNMISNAYHALKAKTGDSQEPKLFRITARRAGKNGEMVRVEFYDNGVGIKREDLGKVFDPFFTTRRETGGTGLGLSVSFGIIRDFGGAIRVESEEGKYTRFIVELSSANSASLRAVR
ncbi:MAG TPA: ATP-binding protein [Pyrinomonadaceae bacterium]|nr:ATP-binding protein [Pyrinomonadaceae bacterium]